VCFVETFVLWSTKLRYEPLVRTVLNWEACRYAILDLLETGATVDAQKR